MHGVNGRHDLVTKGQKRQTLTHTQPEGAFKTIKVLFEYIGMDIVLPSFSS